MPLFKAQGNELGLALLISQIHSSRQFGPPCSRRRPTNSKKVMDYATSKRTANGRRVNITHCRRPTLLVATWRPSLPSARDYWSFNSLVVCRKIRLLGAANESLRAFTGRTSSRFWTSAFQSLMILVRY
jgi:hypothetical protein